MSTEKKMELLADVFECDIEDMSPNDRLIDLDSWTSMTKLSLIVMIDDECGKTLTSDRIKQFETVRDILDFME